MIKLRKNMNSQISVNQRTHQRLSASRRSGFTLVEIIVVTSIVMLLSTVLIVYSNSSRQQIAAFVEAVKISQLILRSKSLAVSTYSQQGVACAYGLRVYYDTNRYELVTYDIAGITDCRRDDTDVTFINDHLEPLSGASYNINPDLVFDREGGNLNDGDSLDYVLFFPPNPDTVLVSGGFIVPDERSIFIKTRDKKLTKRVTVNQAGQVSF
jgi:type II secretory pathway pseudopilin PulG